MKYIFMLILLCGCSVRPIVDRTHRADLEYFYYSDTEIFHVSSNGRTTRLSWSDIQILGIDSLKMYYLEKNAER